MEYSGIVQKLGKQRYLCFSLIAFLLAGPLVGGHLGGRVVMYSVLTLVLITGPLAVASSTFARRMTYGLAAITLASGLLSIIAEDSVFWAFATAFGVLFFGCIAGMVSKEVLFKNQRIKSEVLWGVVNVYLMIGICFSFLFALFAIFDPGLFVGKFMDEPLRDQIYGFIYFSFVTLTTLGYGDVTPNQPFVGTLTYMEALIGQLYLAILVARLVGLYASRED